MSVQWVHNVAHVRLKFEPGFTAARTQQPGCHAGGGHATSVIQFQAGGDESRLRWQRYVSQITAIVSRSTNPCKQSGDRFELANGRCLNEFRYSFWVYTENETENENATSFSAVNESDRKITN